MRSCRHCGKEQKPEEKAKAFVVVDLDGRIVEAHVSAHEARHASDLADYMEVFEGAIIVSGERPLTDDEVKDG